MTEIQRRVGEAPVGNPGAGEFETDSHSLNIILGGHNGKIEDSFMCSIFNGIDNHISGKHSTHVLGMVTPYIEHTDLLDNAFYVGCPNGLHSLGDIVAFSTSDERLKNDITEISNCLDKINSIDAVEFNWNDKQEVYSGKDIGLIAQQVKKIAPEIVTERSNGFLAVKYEKMVPLLVGAIKEQKVEVNQLRKEIEELKSLVISSQN
tara:strand:- start:17905 stop:18522 length:618 start_codon:yes stop_codon:yes gene_type:complete